MTKMTSQAMQNLPEQLGELIGSGGTLGTAQGFDETHYEALYTLGHNLYSQSRYPDAVRVFSFLVLHNHLEPRYMNAYASSLQMAGRHAEAIKFYSIASMMDMSDPVPTFHTAECLLALGMATEAKEALGFVLSQSNAPRHAELKTRAQAMLALLDPADAQGGVK